MSNVGVIIVVESNCESEITKNISYVFRRAQPLQFCLVNNGCAEYCRNILYELSDQNENVHVVNIKKMKTNTMAARAGFRFMHSSFRFKFLGYLPHLSGEDLVNAIEIFARNVKEFGIDEHVFEKNGTVKPL